MGRVLDDAADVSINQLSWSLPHREMDCGIEEEHSVISSPDHTPEDTHAHMGESQNEGHTMSLTAL